jgi:methylisocitrate lyase
MRYDAASMPDARKTTRLRQLIRKSCVAMPGVFNAATARLVERAGFNAVYISGAGLANATAGVPDIGLLTLTEVAQLAGYIASAVKIPALLDADTGFGSVQNVARTVQMLERAGIAGIHLEDQTFPKRCGHVAGKTLIEAREMADKIAAAVEAKSDPDFLIIARTDARASEGIDGAIERANIYLKAGAGGIFPEALQTPAEFRAVARAVKAPLLANMTEFGKSPLLSVKQLAAIGYRMVIFPQSAFRVSMHASSEMLRDLKRSGTQRKWLDRMQSRQELYDLLDYDSADENWPRDNR